MMLVSILLLLGTIIAGAAAVVTTRSDKTQYQIGETIRFNQVGSAELINHYIVPEEYVPILLTPGSLPRWYYRGCGITSMSTTGNTTTSNIECSFQWFDINRLNTYLTDFVYTDNAESPLKTNVSLIRPEKLETKFVYIVYEGIRDGGERRNDLVTMSNPFKFTLNDLSIALDKTSYIQGETVQLTFQQSNLTKIVPSYDEFLYVKVYHIPFSYKNDLLQFNNATQVQYVSSETKPSFPIAKQLITWQKSGQFQMVLFQQYYQVVMAVSDVFTVQLGSNLTKFNVSMDNQTYYPHQYITFDVTAPNMISGQSLAGRHISFTFVNANTTQRDLSDPTKKLDTFTHTWTSSTSSQQFLVMNTMVKRGFYKVFVSINAVVGHANFAVHATKAFRVLSPLVTMTTIPSRRQFIQGEVINFDFYNPYFDFDLARNEYRGHTSFAVDAKFPNPDDKKPLLPKIRDFVPVTSNPDWNYYRNLRIVLPPGQYKIAIFRVIGSQEIFVTSVPGTNFRVVQNNFTISTDKDHYKKGESIRVELSSSRNIPLSVEPSVSWELTIKKNDDPNFQYIFSLSGSFDQSSSSTTKLSKIIPITWDATGVFSFGTSYGFNGFAKKEFVIR